MVLNVKPEAIRPLQENRKNSPDMDLGNDFLYMTPKAQATK